MLQQSESIEDGFRQLDGFRGQARSNVAALVEELGKSTRRNVGRIESTCAQIDLLIRQYTSFLTQLNAHRVDMEGRAGSTAAVVDLRRDWGVLTARTNLFRTELTRWHEVRGLVQVHTRPKRRPLYSPDEKLSDITMSQVLASDDVFSWFHAIFSPFDQSEQAQEQDCFPDIGLSNSDFHAHMHAAYRLFLAMAKPRPARFLDVGCGAGMKVYSALRYFEKASGFDFDPAYVEAGKRFLSLDPKAETEIFQQDALTYDGYDAFDVIYFYRPISDNRRLIEMETRIAKQAQPGTILVAPYVTFGHRFEAHGCGRVAGSVYLAQTPQKTADSWRRKAERVGHVITKDDDSPLKTIWTPIFEVSRANGYDLPGRYKKPKY